MDQQEVCKYIAEWKVSKTLYPRSLETKDAHLGVACFLSFGIYETLF